MQMSVGGQFAQLSKSGTTVTCASRGHVSDLLALTLTLGGIPSSVITEALHSAGERRDNAHNSAERSGGFCTSVSQSS